MQFSHQYMSPLESHEPASHCTDFIISQSSHMMSAAWESKPAFLLNAMQHQHLISRGAKWALERGFQVESESLCMCSNQFTQEALPL